MNRVDLGQDNLPLVLVVFNLPLQGYLEANSIRENEDREFLVKIVSYG